MKNISKDHSGEPNEPKGSAPKRQFIVIEVPATTADPSYPKAVFACDTVEEALQLCRQMNADAGYERYGVQRPATPNK